MCFFSCSFFLSLWKSNVWVTVMRKGTGICTLPAVFSRMGFQGAEQCWEWDGAALLVLAKAGVCWGISQNCRDLCEDSNKHTAHQQCTQEK